MKKKSRTNTIILVIIAIFLAVLAYQFATLPTETTQEKTVEQEIIAKLNLNEDAQITKLTNLEDLKEKYPVIYGEAREGDYEIKTPSKLIIYDFSNDRIIKEFDITNIQVGMG